MHGHRVKAYLPNDVLYNIVSYYGWFVFVDVNIDSSLSVTKTERAFEDNVPLVRDSQVTDAVGLFECLIRLAETLLVTKLRRKRNCSNR
mmetsp:Transcript_87211/g.168970  ORF Transcript_87211/g.168970 Transcript_87211/m.168970 type:complete len:89 (-) Transcript_87211:134-400(-)